MDWSRPYAAVVPSLEGEILVVLWRTRRALTGREIARIARRGSQAGLSRALTKLADHGLVEAEPAGAAILFRLNREHVFAAAVEVLANGRDEFLRRLGAEVGSWRIQPRHLSLFGSAARGEAGLDSDVDLFVVRPSRIHVEDPTWRGQLNDLAERVRRWTGNPAAIAEVSHRDLRDLATRRPAIVGSLMKESIVVAGPPFPSLVKGR